MTTPRSENKSDSATIPAPFIKASAVSATHSSVIAHVPSSRTATKSTLEKAIAVIQDYSKNIKNFDPWLADKLNNTLSEHKKYHDALKPDKDFDDLILQLDVDICSGNCFPKQLRILVKFNILSLIADLNKTLKSANNIGEKKEEASLLKIDFDEILARFDKSKVSPERSMREAGRCFINEVNQCLQQTTDEEEQVKLIGDICTKYQFLNPQPLVSSSDSKIIIIPQPSDTLIPKPSNILIAKPFNTLLPTYNGSVIFFNGIYKMVGDNDQTRAIFLFVLQEKFAALANCESIKETSFGYLITYTNKTTVACSFQINYPVIKYDPKTKSLIRHTFQTKLQEIHAYCTEKKKHPN